MDRQKLRSNLDALLVDLRAQEFNLDSYLARNPGDERAQRQWNVVNNRRAKATRLRERTFSRSRDKKSDGEQNVVFVFSPSLLLI